MDCGITRGKEKIEQLACGQFLQRFENVVLILLYF